MRLCTVNGVVESESFVYYISLVERDNVAVYCIASAIEKINVEVGKDLF